ncbi:MAG: hypothetical protein ACREEY_04695 [Brevundimonas sp.]
MSRMGRRGAIAGPKISNLTVAILGAAAATSASNPYNFTTLTGSVTAGGSGGPFTYAWSVVGVTGAGLWTIPAGQGTAAPTVRVSTTDPDVLTATLTLTVTETATGATGTITRTLTFTKV